jgi:Ran GTPase-activating protein (RanGAP) involved in mRNA processing and transport
MKEVYCPVTHSYNSTEEVLREIKPLVEFLGSNQTSTENITFPRGTVTGDGRLDLCKQSIGIEGCEIISEALKHNKTINAVLFGTDGIGNIGASKVAELIQENETLETIYLGCNNIGAEGVESLADSLTQNKSVKGLWLKRNPIGVSGAEKLAEMLRKNSTLQILDLVNTAIEKDGLEMILDVLIEENRSLKKIYLSGNQIDGVQAEKLKVLLVENDSLETFMLSVNCLKDEGAMKIADGLKSNKTLRELSLASNGISIKGGNYLFEILKENSSLRYLDLGYAISTKVLNAERNNFGDDFAVACRDFLKLNKPLYYLDLTSTNISQNGLKIIEQGILENSNLCKLKINGKLSETAKNHLKSNEQQNAMIFSKEVSAIKSVYRTVK